jgi:sec-independent protein translocase protein TatB
MPSFQDSIVLFVLALLLFGPKKLPLLARELGKWVGEFRRASNEFKMQMEEEMRSIERDEREKKIAAIEAAAPAPVLDAASSIGIPDSENSQTSESWNADNESPTGPPPEPGVSEYDDPDASTSAALAESTTTPLPIATSGDLNIMPPETGLPMARQPRANSSPLGGLLNNIPKVDETANTTPTASGAAEPTETVHHG